MKTVLYIQTGSGIAGSELSLVESLQEIGKYVRPVVIVPKQGVLCDLLFNQGIKYYVVSTPMSCGRLSGDFEEARARYWRDTYFSAEKISEICKKEKVDIIHSNTSVTDVGIIAAIIEDIPHVWHIREVYGQYENLDFDKGQKRKLLLESDAVISISEFVKNEVYESYGVISERIYNGIDCEKYLYTKDIEDDSIALISANISETKGQKTAVDAIQRIVNNGNENIKLRIVGNSNTIEGFLLKEYVRRKKLSKWIEFIDSTMDLSEIRRNASYSLITSRCEPLGRVTIESMLAGNVVIGSSSGATVELIGQNGERGYLYELNDANSLSRTIINAMNSNNYQKVDRARTFAKEHFDVKEYAIKLDSIYETVLEKNKCLHKNKELLFIYEENIKKTMQSHENERYSGQEILNKKNQQIDRMLDSLNRHGLERFIQLHEIHNQKICVYGLGKIGRYVTNYCIENSIDVCIFDRSISEQEIREYASIFTLYNDVADIKNIDIVIITVACEPGLANRFRGKYKVYTVDDMMNFYNTVEG